MTRQAEALLGLAGAYSLLSEDERTKREGVLWGNPVVCTPRVHELALEEGEPFELTALAKLVKGGMVVIADDPAAERLRLATARPGYMNREARRSLKGKPGKHK